jgi:hypothetical protein
MDKIALIVNILVNSEYMYYSINMRRISLQTVLCAVLCAWGIVYLGGCAAPIDLSSFVKDKDVGEIIEKGAGTVNISSDSTPDNLIAGNKKITGLDPNKYYIVEEWDENGKSMGSAQFVGATGERSETLSGIGRVSAGEITGLTNSYHYRVRAADPLPGDVSYSVLTSPDVTQSASNSNGVIILHSPDDDSVFVYTLIPPASPSFDIAELPISPTSHTRLASRSNGKIITLISLGTTIDYVFYSAAEQVFYVLRVNSEPGPVEPPEPGDLIIMVTLAPFSGDNPPQITTPTPTPPVTYPQGGTGTILFTVSNASQYDGIIWYVDGEQVGTGTSFTLNKEQIEYKLVGVYTITVEASKDGKPYSAAIEVTVSP